MGYSDVCTESDFQSTCQNRNNILEHRGILFCFYFIFHQALASLRYHLEANNILKYSVRYAS